MITRRSWFVYGMLLAIWLVLISWQAAEHVRSRKAARAGLRQRAEGISKTLALTMRSTSRGPFASKERVEAWLNGLVEQGEVISIKLFNIEGEDLASAGTPIELPKEELPANGYWDEKAETVTLMNLVDLGTNIIHEFSFNRPPPRPETNDPSATNMAPPMEPGGPPFQPPGTNGPDDTNVMRRNFPGRPRFTPEEFKALQRKESTHGFIMVMSAQTLDASVQRDLWLRAFIGLLATLSVAGYGLAWSSAAKTSDLQFRLVRASELNSHLKEMNLAAAGLAHETRNPLNIVRGLAQMISKQDDASPEIKIKSREIVEETDLAEELVVEADEQMLRQSLFNLVLNAIQAVPEKGEIQIRTARLGGAEASIEIADNGPGVAPENRSEIFKPYFTTNEEGTGLGLAVVQQIVLAHGWEIECLPNPPHGANFRITHVKLSVKK